MSCQWLGKSQRMWYGDLLGGRWRCGRWRVRSARIEGWMKLLRFGIWLPPGVAVSLEGLVSFFWTCEGRRRVRELVPGRSDARPASKCGESAAVAPAHASSRDVSLRSRTVKSISHIHNHRARSKLSSEMSLKEFMYSVENSIHVEEPHQPDTTSLGHDNRTILALQLVLSIYPAVCKIRI